MNDNIRNDDADFEAWLEQSNDNLITATAQDLDIEAMLTHIKRAAVGDIEAARSRSHHVLRDLARTAVGTVTGTLALKGPQEWLPREAKVLQFPGKQGVTKPAVSRKGPSGVLESLRAEATAGEPEAIERLLEAIRPLVVRYCRARIGRQERSFASADDVAQEVCLTVLVALPDYYDHGRSFLAFVYSIAQHKVADARRAAARSREEPVSEAPDGAGSGGPQQERGADGELSERMSRLLALLPANQREILVLRVVVGLSAVETADAIGSTPGAVRVAQHRALARLRKALSRPTEI